jgi:5'-nucleotidase
VLVLFDQDGVVADFDGGVNAKLAVLHPNLVLVEPSARRNFYLHDDYPPEYRDEIGAIECEEGFILGLAPVPGAVEALHAMLGAGHDVRICTAPLSRSTFCPGEKVQWVRDHLGAEWASRVILTKDKTYVRGDVLVDDKPEVKGALVPAWEHLVFERPYNLGAKGRHVNWGNCEQVLSEVEDGLRRPDGEAYVAEGWWHPNTKAGQVHDHPLNPGRSWSVASHGMCEPVYTKRPAKRR